MKTYKIIEKKQEEKEEVTDGDLKEYLEIFDSKLKSKEVKNE